MPDRSPLSLSVLGPLVVVREGVPARLGPQLRRVLALLTVHADEVVSADRMIDVLWGESPPASASHTLQTRVSELRSELGTDRIETRAPGYRLLVDDAEVDSLRFDELVRVGLDAGDPDVAASAFEEALALWRGRPFAEFADDEFASAEVTRLTELRACAVEEHARALIDLGRAAEVIGSLDAEIQAEPFREQLRAVMMLALARAGRPVEALRAFDAYRERLADELGVAPSTELQALNDDILRQEPGLGWQRPSDVAGADGFPTGTVTFVFTDVEGSTRLWQEHPDAMSDVLARHDAIVRDAVVNHDGRVVKSTGDGVHAVFAVPSDAVDAASMSSARCTPRRGVTSDRCACGSVSTPARPRFATATTTARWSTRPPGSWGPPTAARSSAAARSPSCWAITSSSSTWARTGSVTSKRHCGCSKSSHRDWSNGSRR